MSKAIFGKAILGKAILGKAVLAAQLTKLSELRQAGGEVKIGSGEKGDGGYCHTRQMPS